MENEIQKNKNLGREVLALSEKIYFCIAEATTNTEGSPLFSVKIIFHYQKKGDVKIYEDGDYTFEESDKATLFSKIQAFIEDTHDFVIVNPVE
jgi:hypothetical protein